MSLPPRQLAREEEQHFDDLVDWLEWEDDPELQAALQKIRLLQYDQSPQTDTVRQWLETCRHDSVSDPVQTLFELALAKEQESLGYYHALERQIEEPLARRVLHAICQAEEQHKRFLEEQYHRLLTEKGNPLQSWH